MVSCSSCGTEMEQFIEEQWKRCNCGICEELVKQGGAWRCPSCGERVY